MHRYARVKGKQAAGDKRYRNENRAKVIDVASTEEESDDLPSSSLGSGVSCSLNLFQNPKWLRCSHLLDSAHRPLSTDATPELGRALANQIISAHKTRSVSD